MRSGDTVLHRPSGETWTVACVRDNRLSWYGWPEGMAELADCELVEACSDAEHEASLRQWAERVGGKDHRVRECQRQLAALEASRGAAS